MNVFIFLLLSYSISFYLFILLPLFFFCFFVETDMPGRIEHNANFGHLQK